MSLTTFQLLNITQRSISPIQPHVIFVHETGNYLLKSLDAEKFFDLLAGVAQGEAAISPDMATRILKEFAHPTQKAKSTMDSDDDPDRLTERQIEVLQRVVQGLSYKEIAASLFITERTVKYHMQEILQKLHLQNRSQVIAYAVRTGLVSNKSD